MVDINALGEAYSSVLQNVASQGGISLGLLVAIVTIMALWVLVWKGLALWKAAEKKQKIIFVLLLIINDFGILELIYYFWLSKIGSKIINKKLVKKKR